MHFYLVIKAGVHDTKKVCLFYYFFLGSIFCFVLVRDNWLQIDIGHPMRITGLITKGRGDRGQQWVTKYMIAFSNDTRLWVYYNDAQRPEPKVNRKQRRSFLIL